MTSDGTAVANFRLVVQNVIRPNEDNRAFARATTCPTPATYRCNFNTTDDLSVGGFHSAHPGFVHMLFADGAVRAISDNIDPQIWVGSSTLQGREPVAYEP